jgi:hypothetical protein
MPKIVALSHKVNKCREKVLLLGKNMWKSNEVFFFYFASNESLELTGIKLVLASMLY